MHTHQQQQQSEHVQVQEPHHRRHQFVRDPKLTSNSITVAPIAVAVIQHAHVVGQDCHGSIQLGVILRFITIGG